jgi:DNA-binding CsgD family transcriptional regulator
VLQGARRSCHAAVATKLGIRVETVEVHLRSVRKKLAVDDTAIALLEAYKVA